MFLGGSAKLCLEFGAICLVVDLVGVTGIRFTVTLHLGIQAVGGSSEALGDLSYGIAAVGELLNRFNFEFFCVSFAFHKDLS